MLITKSSDRFLTSLELMIWSLSMSVAVDGVDAASAHDDLVEALLSKEHQTWNGGRGDRRWQTKRHCMKHLMSR